MRVLLASFLIVLLLVSLPGGHAGAQTARSGLPAEASDPLNEALRLLETIKASNLDPGWRANAAARAARALARGGDIQAARARAQEADIANAEETKTPPPAALSAGAIDALLAQTYADLRDVATAQKAATAALAEIAKLGDAATRASLFAYVAQALVQIGAADQASDAVLQGLRSASTVAAGREQVTALSALILVQAKLGQTGEARAVLDAAKQSLDAITLPVDRTVAVANLARAEAAIGDTVGAQALAREAATGYARSQQQMTDIQRAVTLGLVALAQNDSGDKNSAQQTLLTQRQAADAVQQLYDRLQAMLALVDAVLQVER